MPERPARAWAPGIASVELAPALARVGNGRSAGGARRLGFALRAWHEPEGGDEGIPMDLKAHIRQIPDFPKPGILFYDISTLLQASDAWRVAVERLAALVARHRPDRVVGIESRGFVVGSPIALQLGVGFGMVRKRGKLPGSVVAHTYSLEYGMDSIEISADLIPAGSRVVVVDDLIATGGTAAATVQLLRKIGAEPVAAVFLIELTQLHGRAKLDVPVETLLQYDT
jgi:adenine phosphoribosyltransferase